MVSKTESILLWASNIQGFGLGMLGPLYVVFAQKIGGDVLELSWVYAIYLMLMGIGVILVGKIADKKGHEYIMLLGYLLSTIATFGYLAVDSIEALFFVQILLAISTACITPTWYALYDKYSGDGKSDGYIWGLSSGLWYFFQGAALIVGGWIVAMYSFDILFICMGIILSVSTLYQSRILRYAVQ